MFGERTAKQLLVGLITWLNVPTFPLNTDGIDPSGRNFTIRDVYIENFDDAVAVKPAHKGHQFSDCAQDMLIENSKVKYSVGMSTSPRPTQLRTQRDVPKHRFRLSDQSSLRKD